MKGDGEEMKKHSRNRRYKGFTLVELIIALVLMSFITIIAVATINLSTEGYLAASVQTSLVSDDSSFISKLNNTIR